MKRARHNRVEAFTLIELLVVVALVIVVGVVLFPVEPRARSRGKRINCTNNLKQLGLASKTWALDHEDKFPMDLSVTNGGTMELTGSNRLINSFLVVSNQLSTPKILVCPADNRVPAAAFDATLSITNVSYFLALDTDEKTPQLFLSGDRNLTNGLPIKNCILLLLTNRPVAWNHQLHNGQGNVGLVDGSVQQLSSSRLWEQLCATGDATNRLMVP
jgi:prepilin-type processing-associated H-X9-DG protein